jgi:hypothetical protein
MFRQPLRLAKQDRSGQPIRACHAASSTAREILLEAAFGFPDPEQAFPVSAGRESAINRLEYSPLFNPRRAQRE